MIGWSWLAFPPLLLWLANSGIRRSLRAERIPHAALPEGLPWQDVQLPTCHGKRLHAWYIPAGRRTLIMMHGWGGNAASLLPLARRLHAAGYTLLLLDARCHGASEDDDFASLPRFAEDIEAGIAWLVQSGVECEAIGIVGHSVGAGAALLVASRNLAVRAVVSLAAFAHPATMMRRWLAAKHVPYWPFGAYVLRYVQRVIGYRFDEIAPIRTVCRVSCPVLVVHGDRDALVPLDEAFAIVDAADRSDVELMVVNGDHEDFGDIDQHLPALLGFLTKAFDR